MPNQTPEEIARDQIDRLLDQSGWKVQSKKNIDFTAGVGVAVREYVTDIGEADYILFVEGTPVGVVEAKKEEEGYHLTVVETQSREYATSQLKWVKNKKPLPFVYESTGTITRFTDYRDPKPRSRQVFSFHRPETFRNWLKKSATLRARLQKLPRLNQGKLHDCQFRAINNLEDSFAKNNPRALIQMATGSGKTYTAITSIYRLLKFADAKRVLFLVDTRNLGKQAEQEFIGYTPDDDNRKFTELYPVQRLTSSTIPEDSCVCISTIQRMYSILRGEELDASIEDISPNEVHMLERPKEVVYNPKYPIEFFDFIVIDECHRSIYNIWKQVLDYYDAFLIGLTATPDKRTFGFFKENIVSEYSHEDAVADGVNVGYDIYTIETKITKKGDRIKKFKTEKVGNKKIKVHQFVDVRNKLTRKQRWQQLDDDVVYTGQQLDRDVVNPSQIRNIIRAFKTKVMKEVFPGREEVPKTLIFAKTDSHADDIINIVREEFGEGNDFCKKITYQATENTDTLLSSLRNDFYPRIAVTVDMIATGTDVKPLECLIFMRDVRSMNYYEQMKGRGTRVLGKDDLVKVTPSAKTAKTHFVIIDAVGVCESPKVASTPIERKPTTPLKDLLYSVMMGADDEDTIVSLGNRLSRLEKEIVPVEREKFKTLAKGKTINQVIHSLWDAFNPDIIEEHVDKLQKSMSEDEKLDITQEKLKQAVQQKLIKEAASIFNGALNEYIIKVRQIHDQIIDMINIDTVTFAGWKKKARESAKSIVKDFTSFIEQNKDEITALKIFYSQPFARKSLTYDMIREVLEVLKTNRPALAPLRVWQAYGQLEKVKGKSPVNELIAIVSLIRRVCGIDPVLTSYELTVNKNFKDWVFRKQAGSLKFSKEQMEWLRMIKDHIVSSFHIEKDDLENPPFGQGGLGRFYKVFGNDTESILDELNEILAA